MTQWNRWDDKPEIYNVEPSSVHQFNGSRHLEYLVDPSTTLLVSSAGLDAIKSDPDFMNATFADVVDVARGSSSDDIPDFHTAARTENAAFYVCDIAEVGFWWTDKDINKALVHYALGSSLSTLAMVRGKHSSEIIYAPVSDADAIDLTEKMHIDGKKIDSMAIRNVTRRMQTIHQRRTTPLL